MKRAFDISPLLIFLSQPWYGEAIAQCLVSEYLLKYFPYEDFIIYEIGAGNGTLAMNILDFLHRHYPSVYDRTRYTIIEISENLVQKQRQKLRRSHPGVQVVHQSIFHWGTREPAPCFFLAMEVVVSSLPPSAPGKLLIVLNRITLHTMLFAMTLILSNRIKAM